MALQDTALMLILIRAVAMCRAKSACPELQGLQASSSISAVGMASAGAGCSVRILGTPSGWMVWIARSVSAAMTQIGQET